jgi:hypothetical protein
LIGTAGNDGIGINWSVWMTWKMENDDKRPKCRMPEYKSFSKNLLSIFHVNCFNTYLWHYNIF